MERFNVGDIVKSPDMDELYEIVEIDEISNIIPKYKINRTEDNLKEFWDYCIDWIKFVSHDDCLRYGEVLTDDEFEYELLDSNGFQIAKTDYYRIRTIRYESRIFYHKMVNGEVVEFKELMV